MMTYDSPPLPEAINALTSPGLVAGIGLRENATVSELLALLDACLSAVSASRKDLVALATRDTRADHPALVAVSHELGLPIIALPQSCLTRDVPNPSARVSDLAGVPSVSEAAALAFGPLVVDKQVGANVTCALASYTPAQRSSAAIAPSTLSTSTAGP
jgi:cobalamin biosynthesis protein CbiG